MEEHYADFIVIGSGPAGQKAAVQAAKLGRSVIVIEKDLHPGGASLNSGTIPSKSLREAILDLTDFYHRSFYGQREVKRRVSINELNFRLHRVLDEQRKILARQFEKNRIGLVRGFARFEGARQVSVLDANGELLMRIRGEYFLIATGSKPRNPLHIPFDDKHVLDSTRLLSIDYVPERMVILGGGIIGSEYASFFAALGTEVTVVDKRSHLLSLLDDEIGLHLQKALNQIGLRVIGGRQLERVVNRGDYVEVFFADGTKLETETLLYALGRSANVDGMEIERAGVTLDKSGYIPVNALFQTVASHIYAAGDVIGAPALASTSMEQGRLVARHAFGAATHHFPDFYQEDARKLSRSGVR